MKTPLDSIVCGLTQSQFLREGSAGSTTVEPFSSLQLVTVVRGIGLDGVFDTAGLALWLVLWLAEQLICTGLSDVKLD